MAEPKKIALVTCASSFERYSNMVRGMSRKLRKMGGFVLYVISNYSVFFDGAGTQYFRGDSAIYRLLETLELDGCILDVNLGSTELVGMIVQILKEREIPALAVNLEPDGIPCLQLETRTACTELLEHLISDHGCTRINLVLSRGNSVMSRDAADAYREVLRRHGYEPDEQRILNILISVDDGRKIYDLFDARGVMKDAQAVICIHDVSAIGLCLEMEDRGFHIPEDLRICSLNYSGNSVAFRPRITGVDRMDLESAEMACDLMAGMLAGKQIPLKNTYSGRVRYAESCGCSGKTAEGENIIHQRVVINKVEAGRQIGQMMRFDDALEEVESLDQLAENLHEMMTGIGCGAYFCCLNESDLPYIERPEEARTPDGAHLDQQMIVLSGFSDRTGRLTRVPVRLKQLTPAVPREGDMFLIMPVCHRGRIFGYTVYLNVELPMDVYNFRICQESIGSSIEHLHREMILRNNNAELDRLHMQDQLTGLHNRFALKRFADRYVSARGYSVAMLDLDGLKIINDRYGHLAGNHAITTAAQAISETIGSEDLVIRYGGDEFLVLSRNTDAQLWESRRADIIRRALEMSARQKLPFVVGISMGFAISPADDPLTIEQAVEAADRAMYRNKNGRKESDGSSNPD